MSLNELLIVTNADICSSPESDTSSVGSTPSFCRSVASISPMYDNDDNLPVATPSTKKKPKKIAVVDEVMPISAPTAVETPLDDEKYYSLSEKQQFEHDRLMIEKKFNSLQTMHKESTKSFYSKSYIAFGIIYFCLIFASLAYSYHKNSIMSNQIVSLSTSFDTSNSQSIQNIDKKIIDTQNVHSVYIKLDDTVHCNTVLFSRWRGDIKRKIYSSPDFYLYDNANNREYKSSIEKPSLDIIKVTRSSLVSFEHCVDTINQVISSILYKAQKKFETPIKLNQVIIAKFNAMKDVAYPIINDRILRFTNFNVIHRLNELKKSLSDDMKIYLLHEASTDII